MSTLNKIFKLVTLRSARRAYLRRLILYQA